MITNNKKILACTIVFIYATHCTASYANTANSTQHNTIPNKAAHTAHNSKQIQDINSQITTLSGQLKTTPDTLKIDGYAQKDLLLAQIHSLELQRDMLLHASPSLKLSLWQKLKNKLDAVYYYIFGKKKELNKPQKNSSQQANHVQLPQIPQKISPNSEIPKKTVANEHHDLDSKINTMQSPMGKTTVKYGSKTMHIKQLSVTPQRDSISCGAHAMRAAQQLYRYLTQPITNAQLIAALNDTTQADAFVKQWMVGSDMLLGNQIEYIRDYFGFDESQISVWDSPIMTSLSEILELNIDKSRPHVFVVNSASQSKHTNAGHWIAIAFDGNNQLIVTDSCNQSRLHHDQRVEAVIEFLCN